ncbi:alkaline phosphatase family protein [Peptoniphilus sp. KCTC 25270]|uniref:alkaline phosphatase family protein n=1 Tax=Peptoniphilus sp. KCTC 25270 TaxID=2897414 RepID=UPI001E2C1AEE|nr:alkaline phosphatase family protein [Peptoniphilus sp. KCTC 25270]MCD1147883.1 alkaline phosphatase family protein [Peptoniphilus sp. KCTC 25270]
MKNKLLVLSYDALEGKDLEFLKNKPYFSQIFPKASYVKNMTEIYPTLTYPIHTTLITGQYPKDHGIYHNQKSDIDPKYPDWSIMGSNWYWEKEAVKVPTLIDTAIENGYTTASILWPVTAGDKRNVNLPEKWPDENQPCYQTILKEGGTENIHLSYNDDYLSRFDFTNTEDMVSYGVEIALDVFRKQTPDLMLVHLAQLDHIRHVYGNDSPEVESCLRQMDIYLGRFLQIAKELGIEDNLNVVVLGDHGQIDIKKVFLLNQILKEKGWITADEKGHIIDYKAYSFSCGFSTHIIPKDPSDTKTMDELYKVLKEIQEEYPEIIETIYTKEEVLERENLSGDFSFVLEGKEGMLFANEVFGDQPVISVENSEKSHYVAMHGHHPSKGDKPPFFAFGPDIEEGLVIEKGHIIDVCKTLASLLQMDMPTAKGAPLPIVKNLS